jgi:hypothetical protein
MAAMTATGTFETSTDVSYSAAFGGQCGHQPAIAEQSRFMSTRPQSARWAKLASIPD